MLGYRRQASGEMHQLASKAEQTATELDDGKQALYRSHDDLSVSILRSFHSMRPCLHPDWLVESRRSSAKTMWHVEVKSVASRQVGYVGENDD